jgi:hypothetical protein
MASAAGSYQANSSGPLPTKRTPDMAQHGESAIGVITVVRVLIGHERGDQNAYRCPTELAHEATLGSVQLAELLAKLVFQVAKHLRYRAVRELTHKLAALREPGLKFQPGWWYRH